MRHTEQRDHEFCCRNCMNNKAHGLQCEKIQSKEQQSQSVEMKFSEFGVDQNFFETYGGIITSIDQNGRNGYLRMKGSYKSSPPIRIHEDSGEKGLWFETMKVGSHVVFKAILNWTNTQWIAQKLIEVEGFKPKPKKQYEVQEYYDEEVAPGMSRRPKPRICPHYTLGKCFRGRDCRFRHEEAEDQEKKTSWADEALEDDKERWVTVDRRGVCRFFSLGYCKKGNNCDFRHEEQTRKVDGEDRHDEPKRMCKFFSWGGCKKGDECEFSHDEQGAKDEGTFWQMQYPIVHPWKPGDWECPECRNHNFAKNESCKMCDRRGVQVPRPSRDIPQTEGEPQMVKRWLKVQEKHAAVVLTYLCVKCTADGATPGCTACKENTEIVNT